jgi:hypothetical protein
MAGALPCKNPCRGTPRFKRKAKERFLSPQEYRRLGQCLVQAESEFPAQVFQPKSRSSGCCCGATIWIRKPDNQDQNP